VTYEDVAGTHLSKKHVAEEASDQAKVSFVYHHPANIKREGANQCKKRYKSNTEIRK